MFFYILGNFLQLIVKKSQKRRFSESRFNNFLAAEAHADGFR